MAKRVTKRESIHDLIERETNQIRIGFLSAIEARGVEYPCPRCGGLGVRCYGSTSTWRGGIGGQMVTQDVCCECWGTGDQDRKGADLRKLEAEARKKRDG